MIFNEKSRKSNSAKASAAGIIQMIAQMLGSFIYRTVFLLILNESYLGINGLFSNVLQLFSLAELGIGSAIQYSMYQPIAARDTDKVGRLIHFYRRVYSFLAFFVLIMGAAFYPFLGSIVDSAQVPADVNLSVVYFLFVGQSAASYLYVYKQSLLIADQRSHLISIYSSVLVLVGYVVKIAALVLTHNYVAVLTADIASSLILNYLFSLWITRQYLPVLRNKNALAEQDKKQIYKHTAGLLCHKIGLIVVTSTDNIILSKFVSLTAVGLYSNYSLLVTTINNTVYRVLSGALPSITNYITTQKPKEETEELLFKLLFANLWISGFTAICLFSLLNPFIELWLGKRFLFTQTTVAFICAQYYLQTARMTGNNFVNGCGLFHLDKIRPLAESAINLLVSVLLVKKIGIAGVFVGTVVSGLLTYFWREPHLLYKHFFAKKPWRYWLMQTAWGLLTISICAVLQQAMRAIPGGIWWFLARMLLVICLPNLVMLALFHHSKEFKYWKTLAVGLLKKLRKAQTK